uniref:Cytochrome P450 n=1 Tax=Oryza barthii TaxID=65489 RepID=A0A0D3G3X6_9ORYZ
MGGALLSFLLSYPEFILAAACFLAFAAIRRARDARRRAAPVPVIWPVVGMLPFVVAHLGRLLDAAAAALPELGCTFMFRGPWLVGADFLVTCDPAVFRHCLTLRDAAVGFMFAAKDLIAAALTWLFYMICTHPHVEAKILDELRSLHTTTTAGAVVFDADELRAATYLHAAVLETLRLYPSAPFEEKEAVGDDVLPGGTAVRKGTRVVFCLYAMGRVEGIWGSDCREFRPERWLSTGDGDGGAGKVRQEPSYKFAAFNAGPRSCLGKDLGLSNIKIAAAAIVYNFTVELVAGHVVEPKDSVVLHTKNGLMVRVKRRETA